MDEKRLDGCHGKRSDYGPIAINTVCEHNLLRGEPVTASESLRTKRTTLVALGCAVADSCSLRYNRRTLTAQLFHAFRLSSGGRPHRFGTTT